MRLADAAPRTWLLATLAGWAVAVWLLSVFGMGGSIERLAEDEALLRPLPAAFEAREERLAALQEYPESARRPLFTDDRRPQPFLIDPNAEPGQTGFDFVLTSVLRTPTLEMAILQPTGGGRSLGVKVGESPDGVAGWSLMSVASRSAVFNGPEGEVTLELRQFDGVGGEPPTPMVATAGPVMPAPANGGPATGGPAAAGASGTPGAAMPPGPVPAPQADSPTATMPAPNADGVIVETAEPVQTSQEQVDAIRKRIEERRARLRQQSLQDRQGNQTP